MYKTGKKLIASLALLAASSLGACAMEDTAQQRVLLVVSNHGELGDTGQATGVWMAELTHPYWALADSDLDVAIDLASPSGGDAPIDAFSVRFDFDEFLATGEPATGEAANDRFMESEQTRHWIDTRTVTVDNPDGSTSEVVEHRFVDTLRLGDIDPADYDAVYFAGGNGAMWQFPDSADVHRTIREFYESGKIVSAACHGTAALLNTTLSDGSYLVEGREVTGFSTAEEEYLGQAEIMPLLLQETFGERGATYIETDPWTPNVVIDGRVISGQNPPSAAGVGEALVAMLAAER